MNENEFYSAIESLGISVDEKMKERFTVYKDLIQEVNQIHNLTAITDDEGIYLKHFYDSLLIAEYIKDHASFLDVGSGAGFPGMVLAIARPDMELVLMEPTTKRTDFLTQVKEACQLDNVLVLNARAEDAVADYREKFDVVSARAVAYLDMLAELTIPFVKLGGSFLAMKGMKGMEEFEDSKAAIKMLGGKLENIYEFDDQQMGKRFVFEIVKIKPTPKKYPRSYAKIKKTPLSKVNS